MLKTYINTDDLTSVQEYLYLQLKISYKITLLTPVHVSIQYAYEFRVLLGK